MMAVSFRLKIVLWYSAVVLVTLFLFRIISIGVIRESLYNDLDESLAAELLFIRDILREQRARQFHDKEIRDEIARRSRLSPRKEFIEIYDIKGAEYYRSPNLIESDALRIYGASAFDKPITVTQFRSSPIRLVGLKDGDLEIYVAYPLTDIEEAISKILSSFFLLVPLSLVFLAVGGLFLVSRFIQPIKALNRYADRLMREPLDRDLPNLPVERRDELGELTQRINDAFRRTRHSLRQILSFSALTSHELKTPLSVLRLQLEQGLNPRISPDELRRILADTYDEVLIMSRIVDDLLTLGKIQAGTFKLEQEQIAFHDLLQEFNEEAILLAQEKNIRVTLQPGPAVWVHGDAIRLRQVLFNLLDNAIKHTPAHGEIRLHYRVENQTITFQFSDTGIGIPEHEQSKVFDLFYRSGSSRGKLQGAGLGLPLVRWIIEAHHGTVSIESRPGHGTTFTIRLPLSRTAALEPVDA